MPSSPRSFYPGRGRGHTAGTACRRKRARRGQRETARKIKKEYDSASMSILKTKTREESGRQGTGKGNRIVQKRRIAGTKGREGGSERT